ncbi:MAG: glycosyltransferase family 2 protein [Candidatus Kaelpia aquatica]|nr:glycosyltransferase family 2 protein [Candidatus Kaelpia aquatica]
MKPLVVIPAHNEERLLGGVLEDILRPNLFDILVVDDGSIDDTYQLAGSYSVAVLKNEINMGKGAALKRGFDYAESKGYKDIIVADADGQHKVEDLIAIYNVSLNSSADIIIGNRMWRPQNMPWIRKTTNTLISKALSCIAKVYIPDTQCGLKLLREHTLSGLNISSNKFEVESEILLKSINKGCRIESVNISSVYLKGRRSHIRPFRDTMRFLRYFFKVLCGR